MGQLHANESLGERIRRIREDRGLTQAQLAHPRFTGAYISQIEAGKRTPSSAVIKHISKRLSVDQEELLTGRPHDYPATLELLLGSATEDTYNGDFDGADKSLRRVLREAKHLKLVRLEARAEEVLGISAERRGRPQEALEHFERALELLSAEPLPLQVEAVAGIARVTHMLGDVRYAVHVLEAYLSRLNKQRAPDPLALMRTYSSLIGRYFGAGLQTKAVDAAHRALHLEPQIGNPQEVASMHLNAARALMHEGRSRDALDSLRRAQDLFASVGRSQDAACAQLAKGIVLADEGRLGDAHAAISAALDGLAFSDLDRARALNELARVERLRGELGEAERLLREAAPLLEESNVQELAMNKRELGATVFPKDPEVGEKNLREAIDLYIRSDNPVDVATTYKMLGQCLKERGDTEGAHAALVMGIEFLERTR